MAEHHPRPWWRQPGGDLRGSRSAGTSAFLGWGVDRRASIQFVSFFSFFCVDGRRPGIRWRRVKTQRGNVAEQDGGGGGQGGNPPTRGLGLELGLGLGLELGLGLGLELGLGLGLGLGIYVTFI